MVYPFSTKMSRYEKGAFSNENNEATGHLSAKKSYEGNELGILPLLWKERAKGVTC